MHNSLMLRLLCSIVLIGLAACDNSSPYTKDVEKTADAYFRITADYTVIDTGEEINFDYVMVCGGTVTHSTYTASTVAYSLFPDTMILPTKTGEAVGIVTPGLCNAWGWRYVRKIGGKLRDPDPIPDDFMPYAMWYPDVEALGFAFGYESDLAYESPYSRLKFHGSTLERVDEVAWEAWRKKAEEAFEPKGGLPGPWGLSSSLSPKTRDVYEEIKARNQGAFPAGSYCHTVAQIDLPERFAVRAKEIAAENNFEFWLSHAYGNITPPANIGPESKELSLDIQGSYDRSFNGGRFRDHLSNVNGGGVRRSNGRVISTKPIRAIDGTVSTRVVAVGTGKIINLGGTGNFYHDVYPVIKGDLSRSAASPEGEYFYSNIALIQPEWNGFGVCSDPPVNYADVLAYAERRINRIPVNFDYDYEERRHSPHRTYFNDVEVFRAPNEIVGGNVSFYAFDRDGHVYPQCCSGG